LRKGYVMNEIFSRLRRSQSYNWLKIPCVVIIETYQWWRRKYSSPSPSFMKRKVLIRNGIDGATWVETGTYLGETTKFLSRGAVRVVSIEPEPDLYRRAQKRFSDIPNVELVNGTSEEVLEEVLNQIEGKVNFWLDGHYSAGVTYLGEKVSPIEEELSAIDRHFKKFEEIAVLVDDVRIFDPLVAEDSGYPTIDLLVDWAESHSLRWKIEHDIFIATNGNQ